MDPDPYLSNFVDPDTTNPGLKYSRIDKLPIKNSLVSCVHIQENPTKNVQILIRKVVRYL